MVQPLGPQQPTSAIASALKRDPSARAIISFNITPCHRIARPRNNLIILTACQPDNNLFIDCNMENYIQAVCNKSYLVQHNNTIGYA